MLLIIPISLFILTFIKYESLSEIINVPMSSYGKFNKDTLRGITILYENIVTQLLVITVFIFINKSIINAKFDLNSGSIERAVERKKKFRKIESIFKMITAIQVIIM